MSKRKASHSEPEKSILWQVDSTEVLPEPEVEMKESLEDKPKRKKMRYPTFQESEEMSQTTWEEQCNRERHTSSWRFGNRINDTSIGGRRATQQERTAQSQFEFQGLGIPSLPIMPPRNVALVGCQSHQKRHTVALPVCEDIDVPLDIIQSYTIGNTHTYDCQPKIIPLPSQSPYDPGDNTIFSSTYNFNSANTSADYNTYDHAALLSPSYDYNRSE